MAVKPPPLDEVVAQMNALVSGGNAVRAEVDRNLKAMLQGALSRLDVVNRAEFDAQTAVLARCSAQLDALEREFSRLTDAVEALEKQGKSA